MSNCCSWRKGGVIGLCFDCYLGHFIASVAKQSRAESIGLLRWLALTDFTLCFRCLPAFHHLQCDNFPTPTRLNQSICSALNKKADADLHLTSKWAFCNADKLSAYSLFFNLFFQIMNVRAAFTEIAISH